MSPQGTELIALGKTHGLSKKVVPTLKESKISDHFGVNPLLDVFQGRCPGY
jgi:hypothetical protein